MTSVLGASSVLVSLLSTFFPFLARWEGWLIVAFIAVSAALASGLARRAPIALLGCVAAMLIEAAGGAVQ